MKHLLGRQRVCKKPKDCPVWNISRIQGRVLLVGVQDFEMVPNHDRKREFELVCIRLLCHPTSRS